MTEQVKSASLRTTLMVKGVEAPVALYKTTGKAKGARQWDTEGARPAVATGAPTPPEVTADEVRADPLAAEPTPAPAAPDADEPTPAPLRKGLRVDGKFIDLTDHLERAAADSATDRMEIVDFIATSAVPRERITGSYYLAGDTPVEGQQMPGALLKTLMRAMQVTRRVAVVRWTKAGKGQSLGVLAPGRFRASGQSLLVLELAWGDQVRAPNAKCLAFNEVEEDAAAVKQVAQLIASMSEKPSVLDKPDPRAALEADLAWRAEHGALDDFEPAPTIDPADESVFGRLERALTAAAH